MAKRLIDTALFNKGLIKNLQGAHKLLWIYLITNCDHAGVWDVYREDAELKTGFKFDWDEVVSAFGAKIVQIDDGHKWFIPSFIEFQYKSMELNPANKTHNSCLQILDKYDLVKGNKVLTSPLQGAKDKDTDKDQEKDLDQEKDTGESVKTIRGEDRKPENRKTPEEWVMSDAGFCQKMKDQFSLSDRDFEYRLKQFSLRKIEEGTLYTQISQPQAGFEKWLNTWQNTGYPSKNGSGATSKTPSITEMYSQS